MLRKSRPALLAAASVIALATLFASGASANNSDSQHGQQSTGQHAFHDSLDPVPHDPEASGHSHTNAHSTLVRAGDFVLAIVHVNDAAPGLVHAQHIHGIGMHMCPDISADADHDGLINTSEGQPDYGPIVVSLTTTGDTSPGSGLAVSRFPVADSSGSYTYVRRLQVGTDIPQAVADNLASFHIVVHGIDTNHNGMYDFSKGPSDLDPTLPQEATVPAACGLIH